jgi:3-oxoacyl-[acyl-carrier-protein] synthase II
LKKRVVVTGIGVISPIGIGKEEYWKALKEGKCGIDMISSFDTEGFTSKIAGEVKDFVPENFMTKKEAKRMDRFCQFAVAASKLAVEDSKINLDEVDMNRFGVSVGSGIGGIDTMEREHRKLVEKGPGRVSPLLLPMMIINMAPGYVAMTFGAKGPNSAIVTACASSTNAIGEAFKIIQRGDADLMFAGGAEASITPLGISGFCTMKALSTRNDDPKTASRPFDENRDGFVMGEGSGMLILEELEHAKERNAKIYAEVAGFGSTADAYHITSPAPGGEGGARAMMAAINDGDITPDDVGYVNAHGTSTPYNDKFETMAIKSVFKDHAKNLFISSTKSMTGHLLGASGSVEAIATIMAFNEDYIHGTMNIEKIDPELDLNYLPNKGIETRIDYAISNSLGFGGHNATILLKRY